MVRNMLYAWQFIYRCLDVPGHLTFHVQRTPEAKRAHLQEHLVYVVGLSVAYQEVDYMEHSVGMAFYL